MERVKELCEFLTMFIFVFVICITLLMISIENVSDAKDSLHQVFFIFICFFAAFSAQSLKNAIITRIKTGSSIHRTQSEGKKILEFITTILGCIPLFMAWKMEIEISDTTLNGVAKFCYVFLMTIFLARVVYMLFGQDPSDTKDCQTSGL